MKQRRAATVRAFCLFEVLRATCFEAVVVATSAGRRALLRGTPPYLKADGPGLGAEGINSDGGGRPEAPLDEVQSGVEDQAAGFAWGFGPLPANGYLNGPAVHPASLDVPNVFPRPYPGGDDMADSVPADEAGQPSTSMPPLRHHEVACVGTRNWKDSRGFDCVAYGLKKWCTLDGEVGSGWEDSAGLGSAANLITGVAAAEACCECGGGYKSIVASREAQPLRTRRLVAPEDRLSTPGGHAVTAAGIFYPRGALARPNIVDNPISPLAPPQEIPWVGIDPDPVAAPYDDVPKPYAMYFGKVYDSESRPDPMGLSARFYGSPPMACDAGKPGASAIDRALDYSASSAIWTARNLHWPKSVATEGEVFWGRWTGSLRIFKPGRYVFDLDIGFSTQSSIKVDGIELLTAGQCRVSDPEECAAKGCHFTGLACAPVGGQENWQPAPAPVPANRAPAPPALAPASAPGPGPAPGPAEHNRISPLHSGPECPHCHDLLCLTPISSEECPEEAAALPSCEEVAPGEMCETDGECATDTRVNNCRRFDVYRKATAAFTGSTSAAVAPSTAPAPAPAIVQPTSAGAAASPAAGVSPLASAGAGVAAQVAALPGAAANISSGATAALLRLHSADAALAPSPAVSVAAPAPGLAVAPSSAPGPVAAEEPMAVMGSRPGELILRAGDHCIDATVMVTATGKRLQLKYVGPDTEDVEVVMPGQVLVCDPVIEACEKPELNACELYRPECIPASADSALAPSPANLPAASPAASPLPTPSFAPGPSPAVAPLATAPLGVAPPGLAVPALSPAPSAR